MFDDFKYFQEFLKNSSALDLADFYEMVRRWGSYIQAHKGEFNYLEDDEWKEIRERLIVEFQKREDIRQSLEEEWAAPNEIEDHAEQLSDGELIEYMCRRMSFMKAHQKFYDFKDEDISTLTEMFEKFVKSVKTAEIAEEQAHLAKIALDKSVADLDDTLVDYYEKTGRIPMLSAYRDKKNIREIKRKLSLTPFQSSKKLAAD